MSDSLTALDVTSAQRMLKEWADDSNKSLCVTGALTWDDAVKQYRSWQVDFIWRNDKDEWFGYKVVKALGSHREGMHDAVGNAYPLMLQRSIA